MFFKTVVSCIFLFLLAFADSLTSITGKTSAATGAVNSVNAVTFLSAIYLSVVVSILPFNLSKNSVCFLIYP